jgi:amino acid transporter
MTLQEWVAAQVAAGARVEVLTQTSAVVVFGRRVNNLLHFLIGFLTCGAWWIVWAILSMAGGEQRVMVTVGADGALSTADAPQDDDDVWAVMPAWMKIGLALVFMAFASFVVYIVWR